MKLISALFTVLLLSACTATQNHIISADYQPSPMAQHDSASINLATTAELVEIGYKDANIAVELFAKKGLDATYFSPHLRRVFNYPEVFILSTRKSDELIIVLVGTDSFGDWFQNMKSNNYDDVPADDKFFVPSGHGGFRLGVQNLLKKKFFSEILPEHIEKFEVRSSPNSRIAVTLTGHSQGAGVAQLVAPVFDGYKWQADNIAKTEPWPYKVRAIYAYAPPYAVTKDSDSWVFMSTRYGDITWQVIRDSDIVPAAYNMAVSRQVITNRHFGHLVRITRDDKVFYEKTDWGSKIKDSHKDKPHSMSGYRAALEQTQGYANMKDDKIAQ